MTMFIGKICGRQTIEFGGSVGTMALRHLRNLQKRCGQGWARVNVMYSKLTKGFMCGYFSRNLVFYVFLVAKWYLHPCIFANLPHGCIDSLFYQPPQHWGAPSFPRKSSPPRAKSARAVPWGRASKFAGQRSKIRETPKKCPIIVWQPIIVDRWEYHWRSSVFPIISLFSSLCRTKDENLSLFDNPSWNHEPFNDRSLDHTSDKMEVSMEVSRDHPNLMGCSMIFPHKPTSYGGTTMTQETSTTRVYPQMMGCSGCPGPPKSCLTQNHHGFVVGIVAFLSKKETDLFPTVPGYSLICTYTMYVYIYIYTILRYERQKPGFNKWICCSLKLHKFDCKQYMTFRVWVIVQGSGPTMYSSWTRESRINVAYGCTAIIYPVSTMFFDCWMSTSTRNHYQLVSRSAHKGPMFNPKPGSRWARHLWIGLKENLKQKQGFYKPNTKGFPVSMFPSSNSVTLVVALVAKLCKLLLVQEYRGDYLY